MRCRRRHGKRLDKHARDAPRLTTHKNVPESLRVTTSVRSRSRSRSFALKTTTPTVVQSVSQLLYFTVPPRAREPLRRLSVRLRRNAPEPPLPVSRHQVGMGFLVATGRGSADWARSQCGLTAQRFPCAVFAERTALENGGKSSSARAGLRMRSIFKMPFVRPPPRPRPWSGA